MTGYIAIKNKGIRGTGFEIKKQEGEVTMNQLYQSPRYKKYHWYVADIIMLIIVCINVGIGGVKMLSPYNVLYIGAALFLWIAQMAMIIICEKDSQKRKDQYLTGIEVFVIPVLILLFGMGMR